MGKHAWVVACAEISLTAACVALTGCGPGSIGGGEASAGAQPPNVETQAEGSTLADMFEQAARDFDVPARLLASLAWVETRGEMIAGEEEFPGRAAAFGLMALRGADLVEGAAYAGVSVEQARTDPAANIRAAAALLSRLADDLGIDRDELGDWADAVVAYSGIEELEARSHYIHDEVYEVLRHGVSTEVLQVLPDEDLVPYFPLADATTAPGPDYAPAYWRESPNYSSRPSGAVGKPQLVIIHSCEGSYSGCWGWLKSKASGVSAHYVVDSTGSEITQLVRESKKAWHIAATYKCSLNDQTACNLDGYGSNNFTIGIEHAGYAKQSSWDSGLLKASAKLVCDITHDQGIARDKYHVVAHGQLQPYNRIDPGPNWPWSSYLGLANSYCGGPPPNDPPVDPPDDPPDDPPAPPPNGKLDVIVDSNNAANVATTECELSSTWTASKNVAGYYNTGYFWRSTGASSDLASFKVQLSEAKKVTVYAWWSAATDRSSNAPFIVFDGNGVQLDVVYVDQRKNGGTWVKLGTYALTAGWNAVALSRWTNPGAVVVADAVRFVEAP